LYKYQNNSIEIVLRLLLLTVRADEIHQAPERAELRRQISNLEIFTNGIFFGLYSKIDSVIDAHDLDVQGLINEFSLPEVAEQTISQIDDPELAYSVYNAMRAVALADGETVSAENLILQRAAKAWDQTIKD